MPLKNDSMMNDPLQRKGLKLYFFLRTLSFGEGRVRQKKASTGIAGML